MRILILGSGLMGPAAAWLALRDPTVLQVTMGDRNPAALATAVRRLPQLRADARFATATLEVADPASLEPLLARHSVAISALPQAFSAPAIRAAARAGVPLVDLTRPPQAEVAALAQQLRQAGALAVIGCGVDPGLTEIVSRHLAEGLDRVDTLHGWCGGLPEKPAPPLGYKIVFGGRQLPLRDEAALVLQAGELVAVPRYSGQERVSFAGIGEVEGYHEGFMPWLLELPALRGLREGSQKTLRWPGYVAKVAVLRELGLLSDQPLAVDGVAVAPRALLNVLLGPRVRMARRERDLTLFRVEATGEKAGRRRRYRVEMVDRYDSTLQMTSMARVTAFTAVIVARMIGRGEIVARGLFPPEQLVAGPLFHRLLQELQQQQIRFELTTERIDPL